VKEVPRQVETWLRAVHYSSLPPSPVRKGRYQGTGKLQCLVSHLSSLEIYTAHNPEVLRNMKDVEKKD
jgi:hypothetical protein